MAVSLTKRKRDQFLVLGSIIVLMLMIATDPDAGIIEHLPFGASTAAQLLILIRTVWYVALLHLSRKYVFDYIDLEKLSQMAKKTSQGAGLLMVSIALWAIAFSVVIWAATH